MVDTGIFTGRSPDDKYFVEEDSSEKHLWWGPVNKKIDNVVIKFILSSAEVYTCHEYISLVHYDFLQIF